MYSITQPSRVLSAATQDTVGDVYVDSPLIVAAVKGKCSFCGNSRHSRARCPACESICHKCLKKGHFAKVCRAASTPTSASAATTVSDDRVTLAFVSSAATPGVLSKAVAKITISGTEVEGLIDSVSSDSFIHPDIVKRYALSVHLSQCAVSMATSTLSAQTSGCCQVKLNVNGRDYHEMRLALLPQLCSDVILGQDFQRLHDSVSLKYGGDLPLLVICGLSALRVDPPELFANLSADCHPVAAKSRRFSYDDRKFIEMETQILL